MIIIPDVNVLIYAFNKSSSFHKAAKKEIKDILNSDDILGLTSVTILGFTRLAQNSSIFSAPLKLNEIQEIISNLLKAGAQIIELSKVGYELFFENFIEVRGGSSLTTDVYLASLTLENKAMILTNDKDFLRFKNLKIKFIE